MIDLRCPCGHTFNLPDHIAGKKIRCKYCGGVLNVPGGAPAPAPAPSVGPFQLSDSKLEQAAPVIRNQGQFMLSEDELERPSFAQPAAPSPAQSDDLPEIMIEAGQPGSLESQLVNPKSIELVVVGTRPCPSCGDRYPPAVVICVGCGLNIDTGKKLQLNLDASRDPDKKKKKKLPWYWQLLKSLGLVKKKKKKG